MFYLICVWINGWVNNRETGDLRCHHAHYDVIVMWKGITMHCFLLELKFWYALFKRKLIKKKVTACHMCIYSVFLMSIFSHNDIIAVQTNVEKHLVNRMILIGVQCVVSTLKCQHQILWFFTLHPVDVNQHFLATNFIWHKWCFHLAWHMFDVIVIYFVIFKQLVLLGLSWHLSRVWWLLKSDSMLR